jgi:hypothetical protein
MIRLKAMAAAVLLATCGMASAQMALPETGNGSLTFVAYDPVTLTTYSFNTGRFFQGFLPSPATTGNVTAPGTTFSFALPSWSSFMGTAGLAAANVLWGVFASDGLAPTGVMTTGASAGTVTGLTRVNNINNNFVGPFANAHNFLGTHPASSTGHAIYQTTAAAAGTDSAYGGYLFGASNNFNGNTSFSVLGSIGQSLGFYLFTGSNLGVNACTPGACTRYTYGNAFGNSSWTLNTDGTLQYTAPVPEASTYAMMLAGLLTLGFVARRRMNGK